MLCIMLRGQIRGNIFKSEGSGSHAGMGVQMGALWPSAVLSLLVALQAPPPPPLLAPNKQSKKMVWLYAIIGVIVGLVTLSGASPFSH